MIRFRCSHCGNVTKTEDQLAGKRLICPGCSEVGIAPNLIAAPPPIPAALMPLPPLSSRGTPSPLSTRSLPSLRLRWFIVAIGVAIILFLAVYFALRRPTTPTDKLWSRPDFERQFMGTTPEQVRARLGSPARADGGDTSLYWYYDDITRDPVTGKMDDQVEMVFLQGRVATINFYAPRPRSRLRPE